MQNIQIGLKVGERYYIPNIAPRNEDEASYLECIWENSWFDRCNVSKGLAYRTKDEAIIAARDILGLITFKTKLRRDTEMKKVTDCLKRYGMALIHDNALGQVVFVAVTDINANKALLTRDFDYVELTVDNLKAIGWYCGKVRIDGDRRDVVYRHCTDTEIDCCELNNRLRFKVDKSLLVKGSEVLNKIPELSIRANVRHLTGDRG